MTTISDVARLASVSEATVSRVVNKPEAVSAEKRQRVEAAIAKLGFVPSTTARGLRLRSFSTIALLVGDISQPFHGRLAKAVERAAESNGFTVMLGDLDHSHKRLVDLLHTLPKRGVAGAILATADELDDDDVRAAIKEAQSNGLPLVTTSHSVRTLDVPAVVEDLERIGNEAAEHLLSGGATSLALLAGKSTLSLSMALKNGVRAAARAHGLPASRTRVINAAFNAEPARRAVAKLLDEGRCADGFICANTPVAMGVLRALGDAGIAVPTDVSVIACENVPSADFMVPSISTVAIDIDELGEKALHLLLDVMSGNATKPSGFVSHSLLARESTLRSARDPQRSEPR